MKFDNIDVIEIGKIARAAGEAILSVYDSDAGTQVEYKGDGSPLTVADKKAHDLIEAQLTKLSPDIPILSEESIDTVGDLRLTWQRYWLVDPLDGTKEFIKRNGEFTVNIALIDKGKPCIGVVYAPVLETLYFAASGQGAFKVHQQGNAISIQTRPLNLQSVELVASRSHLSEDVAHFIAKLETKAQKVSMISMGSSLKLCLVAEGSADIYPRLGLTSEWDTAAAQCVVESAGGMVLDCQNQALSYTKKDILNPWFLVLGEPQKRLNCLGEFI